MLNDSKKSFHVYNHDNYILGLLWLMQQHVRNTVLYIARPKSADKSHTVNFGTHTKKNIFIIINILLLLLLLLLSIRVY
jgi:hypothetical protein